MKTKVNILFVLLCLLSASANAQNYVVYSGGVGSDEREAAPTTGTRLVFFAESGDYLADVKVVIKDKSGKVVVDTVSKGPWLILNLPAGQYSVRAESSGSAQGGTITVNTGSNQEFGYRFKGQ